MPVKEITASAKKPGVKVAVGSQARLILNADGTVNKRQAASDRPTITICPAACRLLVGTDADIAKEVEGIKAKEIVK